MRLNFGAGWLRVHFVQASAILALAVLETREAAGSCGIVFRCVHYEIHVCVCAHMRACVQRGLSCATYHWLLRAQRRIVARMVVLGRMEMRS